MALAQAIEEKLKERWGGDRKSSVENSTLESGRSDEIAAQKSGLGKKDTYRAAQKVVERDIPELVEAMDRGKLPNLGRHGRKKAEREQVAQLPQTGS